MLLIHKSFSTLKSVFVVFVTLVLLCSEMHFLFSSLGKLTASKGTDSAIVFDASQKIDKPFTESIQQIPNK